VLGLSLGDRFYATLLSELGLDTLRTPNELFRFGEALCARSSDVAVLGHVLKTEALLRGAALAEHPHCRASDRERRTVSPARTPAPARAMASS
jgi:hypothetical protein